MRKKWNIWMVLGALLVAAALCLSACNLVNDWSAGRKSAQVVGELAGMGAGVFGGVAFGGTSSEGDLPVQGFASSKTFSAEAIMPVKEVDGNFCVGIIRIPSLGLELPVMSEWSYDKLAVAPCRYSGSVYAGDMVVAGHSYGSHFGSLRSVGYGAEVSFTDMDGNVFLYEVSSIEELDPYAVGAMTESDWELTLFTCTFDGSNRVAVRCEESGFGA